MESPKGRPDNIFISFFIVKSHGDGTFSREWTFPEADCNVKEFNQYENFCFPVNHSAKSVEMRNQHFTFMLTDINACRKYGCCKMVDTAHGKRCYCFLSEFPWFEIFYKCLNCVCTVHVREDTNTLHSIVAKLYELPIPKPNDIVSLSTSLTFSVPDETVLPSIPEHRNMMEYLSAINPKNMIDIYSAFMYERRVIFVSSNLSVLSGCVFASEALLQPLSWQHIFIPLLHQHIIDYCSAPMPYIIGMHTSLYAKIEGTPTIEGVVIVNIDNNSVFTPYDDTHKLPNEAISYLRTQLNKPNISVGSNLSQAFLRTQARLFGDYRVALKFPMGGKILFDEDKFVSLFKPGSKRNFAEELIHLQSFHQFIDKRLYMLNKGIGFRDPFEIEVSAIQHEYDYSSMYKEWISRKGSEFIHQAKVNMKQAKTSAKQSMREIKNSWKSTSKETVSRELSLTEDITTARPPRPPRPPPPNRMSKTLTRFKVIDDDHIDNTIESTLPICSPASEKSSSSGVLIDFSEDSSPLSVVDGTTEISNSQTNDTKQWSRELLESFGQDLQRTRFDSASCNDTMLNFEHFTLNSGGVSKDSCTPPVAEDVLIVLD